jgi:antitoxin (DNA-binding transcriptional repressor) of toxin-antitoxin stability system
MRIKATEASRGFSALLTRVAAGETVEVDRHGEVVALLVPPRRSMVSGDALIELLARLPRPDPGFADDVASVKEVVAQPVDPWRP